MLKSEGNHIERNVVLAIGTILPLMWRAVGFVMKSW